MCMHVCASARTCLCTHLQAHMLWHSYGNQRITSRSLFSSLTRSDSGHLTLQQGPLPFIHLHGPQSTCLSNITQLEPRSLDMFFSFLQTTWFLMGCPQPHIKFIHQGDVFLVPPFSTCCIIAMNNHWLSSTHITEKIYHCEKTTPENISTG